MTYKFGIACKSMIPLRLNMFTLTSFPDMLLSHWKKLRRGMLALTQESRATRTVALFGNGALARGGTVLGIPLSSGKLKDGTASSDEDELS